MHDVSGTNIKFFASLSIRNIPLALDIKNHIFVTGEDCKWAKTMRTLKRYCTFDAQINA